MNNNTINGAEVIVIGSGLSGLSVANGLVKAGVRDVLVMEAGRFASGDASLPSVSSQQGLWTTLTPPHYRPIVPAPYKIAAEDQARPASWQGQGVGGRSLYWHGVILRLEDYALGDPCWPAEIRTQLIGEGHQCGMYARIEDELAHWRMATPQLRELAKPYHEADAAFAALLGEVTTFPAQLVPQAFRYAPPDHWLRQAYTPLDEFGSHCDGLANVVADGLTVKGPRIASQLTAVKVFTAHGRASGLVARDSILKQDLEFHASNIVLAAGTIENTRLVGQLRSDQSPLRFCGLNDHIVQGFVVRIPMSRLPAGLSVGAFALLTRDLNRRCNVFARLHTAGMSDGTMILDVWALGEQLRSKANFVSVAPRVGNPSGGWDTEVTAALTEQDELMVLGERDLLQRTWLKLTDFFQVKHSPLQFGDFFIAPAAFPVAWAEAVSSEVTKPIPYAWPLGASDHEGGTLPLGTVLDEHGAVPGADGVFVVGPATFPRAGAANPSLTTLALARLTAEFIASQGR